MSAPKTVVIGIDGLDPGILTRAMQEGRAPHFASLRDRGMFSSLATTNPAQSPVAWASYATGANPGKHGLFDFLRRDSATYLPQHSIFDANTRNLLGRRSSMFRPVLRAEPFWAVTSRHNIPTTVLKWPVNFPPGEVRGTALAGFSTPDLHLSLGRYSLFTTARTAVDPHEAKGDVCILDPAADTWEVELHGPNRSRIPMTIACDRQANSARITIQAKEHTLVQGAWSPWIHLSFPLMLGKRVAAICRWRLASCSPLQLYVTALHVDPHKASFPISYPDSYAQELATQIGPFHTLGMPEETNGVVDGSLPYDAFLALANDIQSERERMFWHTFQSFSEGAFAFVFDTLDRVQHIFWMTRDAQHPLHGREGNELFATAIDAFYERLDAFLGTLLERLDSQTLLLVVSDHGFSTFRRAIHLNSWLRDQGYLVLRDGPVGLPFFENVDWQRTRAYALGFSGMYINRAGREAKGCVAEHAVQPLLDEITQKLRTLTDSKNGEAVLRSVTPSRDLYVGEHAGNAPDLVLGYREGYRTSWQTTIGSAPEKLIEDNTKKWSGDHLVDPSIVPGAFLCNRKLAASSPTVYDLAPTILGSFHIAQPSSMDGKNLFSNA